MNTEQQLLEEAVIEIRLLRQQNSQMATRLDMFDKMMVLFHSTPSYPGVTCSEDLVWKIEKHLQSEEGLKNL